MAVVRLSDGTEKMITAEQGLAIWKILSGEEQGTVEQQEFASQVSKVYLNWRNAPDDYLLANRDVLADIVKQNWMMGATRNSSGKQLPTGNLTQPEYDDKDCWRVSKLLGLL